MTQHPFTTAMVLAAGRGTRMRPVTDTLPKPLVKVGGKALIDWALDEFATTGIERAVVNVHHLAPMICNHLVNRTAPKILISDETELLLETGGGIVKALPLLGAKPFLAANTDAFTVGGTLPATHRLHRAWDETVDALLLLHPMEHVHGFDGPGDFFMDGRGRLTPRGAAPSAPFVYAGVQILRPELFGHEKAEPFSMWRVWKPLMETGRLAGVVQDGEWFHVGTPEAIDATDAELKRMGFSPNALSSRA